MGGNAARVGYSLLVAVEYFVIADLPAEKKEILSRDSHGYPVEVA